MGTTPLSLDIIAAVTYDRWVGDKGLRRTTVSWKCSGSWSRCGSWGNAYVKIQASALEMCALCVCYPPSDWGGPERARSLGECFGAVVSV